jgi:NAD(P)H-hydrate epimerase
MTAALVSAEAAKALDAEASAAWGLNPFALVEAAGRACAAVLTRDSPALFRGPYSETGRGQEGGRRKAPCIVALAGSGNNAADALVMLRSLVSHNACPEKAVVFITKPPAAADKTPLSEALCAVQKLGVPVLPWDIEKAKDALAGADLVIDGIAGTGVSGPLRGAACEMAEALNALHAGGGNAAGSRPFIVSVDLPSGLGDAWGPELPAVTADATLAIEPQKLCLYTPEGRKHAGRILPVSGIFPAALTAQFAEAELLEWEDAAARIPALTADAYKYSRGVAEIRAGSPGAAGAAKLAALGAQAAGAGIVRLVVDPSLYPVLAPGASGVMVSPDDGEGRFQPDAVLLGPGWGRGMDRLRLLEKCLPLEEGGVPLVLDADAISLAKDAVFHGNAVLTPHVGEFAAWPGLSKAELLANPAPHLRRFAAEKKAHILFKSHVLFIASPDGRLSVVDGMCPVLGAGGSGDVLAGFCAGIAARMSARRVFDGHACACAAAALLVRAARSPEIQGRFVDPVALAHAAAVIAGRAWLPADSITGYKNE